MNNNIEISAPIQDIEAMLANNQENIECSEEEVAMKNIIELQGFSLDKDDAELFKLISKVRIYVENRG